MSSWRQNIRHVEDGQAANAGNVSRPSRDLAGNQQYLKEWLDAADLGETVVAHEVTIEPALAVGEPAYWDSTNQRYGQALAAVETNADGDLVLAESAECVGILGVKHSETLGTIILGGRIAVDLTNVATAESGSPAAGRYFLSGTTAGRLTRQRPGVGISVLYYDGTYAHVQPSPRDFLASHSHHHFTLYAVPAGTTEVPAVGDDHEILVADDSSVGWLPADHASFNGLAPTGAKFGYNLAAHPELERLWPPIPVTAAAVAVERPPISPAVTDVLLGETGMDSQFVLLTTTGIWWMSNCYNQAPWPVDYVAGDGDPAGSSCGPGQRMRIVLYFAKMLFATDHHVVTSLQPADGSPIQILNCDDADATTGDLQIQLDMSLLLDSEADLNGSLVIKSLNDLTLQQGIVTEGLLAGTNVTLSASDTRELTAAEKTAYASDGPLYRGAVQIDVDLSPEARELSPQVIKLGDAKERTYNDTPHIGFPAGRTSAVRLKFNVPPTGLPSLPMLKLRVAILGRTTGTLPALTVTRRNLSRALTATVLPDGGNEVAVTFNSLVGVTADQYVEVESDGFAVAAGDTIYMAIIRDSNDAYAGELGILRFGGVIYSGS